MTLADRFRETLNVDSQDVWEKSAPQHPSGCSECSSIRWDCRCGKSSLSWNYSVLIASWSDLELDAHPHRGTERPADQGRRQNQVAVRSDQHGFETSAFEVDVFSRRGTDPGVAFLHQLGEKQNLSYAEFLVDAAGYLTSFIRQGLSGQLKYRERNTIGKWFQTRAMRIDCFHAFWRGQSKERSPLPPAVQNPLQPRPTEPGA